MYTSSHILRTLIIVYQEKPFELQTEDGFIKKPKHVLMWYFNYLLIVFYIIEFVLDWKLYAYYK